MSRRKYSLIAVRRYAVEGEPDREILVKIGEPLQPGTPDGDWSCPVLIEGLDLDIKYVEGVDAVQAIQSAMLYARHELDASGLPITWLGGEPGDLGLPRPLSGPFGLWFDRRLEKMVDAEIERVGEVAMELHKARERTEKRRQR